ncbi:MAG: CinA family protein, partial [Synergistaceae bacterium]|nr:CinA family protein [Synergistaceae bacterium]
NILGVQPEIIDKFGAVSSECAEAMALGALKLFNADFAVSVTGIAGPDGGSDLKPVGTVWFGLAAKNNNNCECRTFCRKLPGERGEVRLRAVRHALAALWRSIRDNRPNVNINF